MIKLLLFHGNEWRKERSRWSGSVKVAHHCCRYLSNSFINTVHDNRNFLHLSENSLFMCYVYVSPLQIGPSDQLGAPSHFPPAVFCYTLKEMSVVWHLFGGRDFGGSSARDQKKKWVRESCVGSGFSRIALRRLFVDSVETENNDYFVPLLQNKLCTGWKRKACWEFFC